MKLPHHPLSLLPILLLWIAGVVHASEGDPPSNTLTLLKGKGRPSLVPGEGPGTIRTPELLEESTDEERDKDDEVPASETSSPPLQGAEGGRGGGEESSRADFQSSQDDDNDHHDYHHYQHHHHDEVTPLDTFFLTSIWRSDHSKYGRAEVEILRELVYYVRRETRTILENLEEKQQRELTLRWQSLSGELGEEEKRQTRLDLQSLDYINEQKRALDQANENRELEMIKLHHQRDNLRRQVRQEREALLDHYKAADGEPHEAAAEPAWTRLVHAQGELSQVEETLAAWQVTDEGGSRSLVVQERIQAEFLWNDLARSDCLSRQYWLLGRQYVERYLCLKRIQYMRVWTAEMEWHLDDFLIAQYQQLRIHLGEETDVPLQQRVRGTPRLFNSCERAFKTLAEQLHRVRDNSETLGECLIIIKQRYQDLIEQAQRTVKAQIKDRLRALDEHRVERQLAYTYQLAKCRETDEEGAEEQRTIHSQELHQGSHQEVSDLTARLEELMASLERTRQAEEDLLEALAVVGPQLRRALETLIEGLMPPKEEGPVPTASHSLESETGTLESSDHPVLAQDQ